jgi:type II secretory pathway pseudopilin PulG
MRTSRHKGQTLLELVAATTIISLTLVPALRMMRDSLRISRQTERTNLMATLAASKLEEHLLRTAGTWGTGTFTGDFSADGYATMKLQVVRSDAAGAGGITGSLMSITSTVWDDTDNDNVIDTGELRSVFASKLARNAAYEYEAAGT